jgi:hypothetical protein
VRQAIRPLCAGQPLPSPAALGRCACARARARDFALAVFLARFWSAPDRLALAFPVDRRKLADRPDPSARGNHSPPLRRSGGVHARGHAPAIKACVIVRPKRRAVEDQDG